MKKLLFTVLIGALSLTSIRAQDVHFSQFNASPLTLNPALAGLTPCTYRAAINYRNQWNAIPAPYETFSAAFDIGLFKKKWNGNMLGIGVYALNDRSGDGDLSNLNFNLLLAYHQQLGDNVYLSAGFQGSYVQRNVSYLNLIFEDQILNNLAPTSEGLIPQISYFDMDAGLHLTAAVSEAFQFNIGGAYYHILQPNESFLGDNNVLTSRYVGHAGSTISLGEYFSLSPSVLYMMQASASELIAGTSIGYHMEGASLFAGAWYRNQDAIIALVGLEVARIRFGASYDITVSDADQANNGKGGFELSLSYTGCIVTRSRHTYCPKF